MVSSEIIGYFVTHGGYRPVFFLMACMHPIAICVLWTAFRSKPVAPVSVSAEEKIA
jgi:ACS family hexuronate transporter-like MFS transporter